MQSQKGEPMKVFKLRNQHVTYGSLQKKNKETRAALKKWDIGKK